MAVNVYATKYVVEIQSGRRPEGVLAPNVLEVEVENHGGGPFLRLKTSNSEPSEDLDEHTIEADRT